MSKPLLKGFVESFEIKDIDKKSGTLIQAYTRYDVKDSDGDYGRKGMFTKTWSENKSRIRHLLNHDTDRPIGEPQKFWEDDSYAYMQSQLGKNLHGEDFRKMVESNLIKEASYGYTVTRQQKLKDGNELLEVKLWEVSSLTGWGANEFTPIISFQKGMNKQDLLLKHLERYAALDSFCKNSDASDDTIEQLEQQKKHLETYIYNFTRTDAASEAPPQDAASLTAPQPQIVKGFNYGKVLAFIELQKQLITA